MGGVGRGVVKRCARPVARGAALKDERRAENRRLRAIGAEAPSPGERAEDALRITQLSINRAWVSAAINTDFSFKFLKTTFKISFPREAPMVDLGCPCLVD